MIEVAGVAYDCDAGRRRSVGPYDFTFVEQVGKLVLRLAYDRCPICRWFGCVLRKAGPLAVSGLVLDLEEPIEPRDLEDLPDVGADVAELEFAASRRCLDGRLDQPAHDGASQVLDLSKIKPQGRAGVRV